MNSRVYIHQLVICHKKNCKRKYMYVIFSF